jgi:hypothetical protein
MKIKINIKKLNMKTKNLLRKTRKMDKSHMGAGLLTPRQGPWFPI